MVIKLITKREFKLAILAPSSTFKARMLSATIVMDRPKESAIPSMIFICLKKTSVQAKLGRKKITVNHGRAMMAGKRSRKGKANSNICLIGDNQYMPYVPSALLIIYYSI